MRGVTDRGDAPISEGVAHRGTAEDDRRWQGMIIGIVMSGPDSMRVHEAPSASVVQRSAVERHEEEARHGRTR